MANDGTEHSSDVAGSKRHHQLLWLAEGVSRNRDNVLVEELHRSLKGSKLHHCVRNLSHPQWGQPLEETKVIDIIVIVSKMIDC